MSEKIKNSLSTFLDQAIILTNNSMETLSKINDAVTSNEDSVTLTITNPSDETDVLTYNIPSFGYLKNKIEVLENTLSTMSNVSGTTGSRLRLSDGSYRKIITSKVPSEAPTITSSNNITNFSFKSNWFFEDMINPMLYVTWDFTGQIDDTTERVMIQRYILDCDTAKKKKVFNSKFNGKSDITYKDFLYTLVDNNIHYTLDDEIKDLPPRSKRYTGNFSVIRGEVENDLYSTGKSMRYTLVSLQYTDNRAGVENTRILSVGDVVEVNSSPVTTRYKVNYVDTSANKIGLTCIEGLEPVRVGVGTLRISASYDSTIEADIPIGFDERQVIFVKAIDPDSNMPSVSWSNGTGFYSNELTYKDSSGNTKTLQSFYQKNVVDFGQILLSYGEDYYPTIREGIIPDAPVLNYADGTGDFKIVQINSQLTEGTDNETFRNLVSTKDSISASLDKVNEEIETQKTVIQTTDFVSSTDKQNAQDKLNSLITEQSQLVTNYNSTINTIKSKYTDGATVSPKYRVRGFWDMPTEKISPSSGVQRIIKFKIRYRYLSSSGAANKEEEFTYTSNGVQVTGKFSNWNEIETKLRPRVKVNGSWSWEYIDTADPDTVNINQLDIPIQKGEQVEIQVKSVCEAGFPSNPMESAWSDSIIVAFSDFAELEADDISSLIEQNKMDSAVSNVASIFKPMNSHIASSFYANDTYYAHSAQDITSGFLTDSQTPISLYDKLQDLQQQVTQIIEQINHTAGNLIVTLCTSDSSDTKVQTLTEGGVTYVNAGDYVSAVAHQKANLSNGITRNSIKNGTIITKTYYLDITTDVQSGLYLLSKFGGNRKCMVPSTVTKKTSLNSTNSFDATTGYNFYDIYDNVINPSTTSSEYYKTKGRYDLVPINLTGANDDIDYTTVCPDRYQSAQCHGQFVYSRFRDVSDTFDMYANTTKSSKIFSTNSTRETTMKTATYSENAKFIDSELCVETSNSSSDGMYITEEARENYYGTSSFKEKEFDLYCQMTATDNIDYSNVSDANLKEMYSILYRLPKNFYKEPTTASSLFGNKSTIKLVNRITNNQITSATSDSDELTVSASTLQSISNNLMKRTINSLNVKSGGSLLIEPKIQSAYGMSDLGLIKGIDIDDSGTNDDGSYVTTHKIGYSDGDKYLSGSDTCNSYLFLSPVNHEAIQVEGDTSNSTTVIDSNSSIKIPIVYQYRMTDYSGNIFGVSGLKASDERVKNTKFANIIGIDIWTDTSSDKPKQYDILVYSTYGSSSIIDSGIVTTTGTQSLLDTSKTIAKNLSNLVKQSTSTTKLETGTKSVLESSNSISPIKTIK